MASDRGISFLIGLAIGGTAGGVLAALLAPRPGGEVRSELRTRGIDLKERTSKVVDEVKEMGRATVDDQRSRLQDALAEGREAAAQRRAELLDRYERSKRPDQT